MFNSFPSLEGSQRVQFNACARVHKACILQQKTYNTGPQRIMRSKSFYEIPIKRYVKKKSFPDGTLIFFTSNFWSSKNRVFSQKSDHHEDDRFFYALFCVFLSILKRFIFIVFLKGMAYKKYLFWIHFDPMKNQ